ncbi:MAG: hypothetical protein K1X94_32575 [Sandaracinaceae bacterium]|nr:hypothetical protein [Sandaracinaceae bacterium]
MHVRLAPIALVVALAACEGEANPDDVGAATLDAARSDAPGLDAPGLDAPGLDAPGLDAPGLDAPLPDAPLPDAPGVDVSFLDAPSIAPDATAGDDAPSSSSVASLVSREAFEAMFLHRAEAPCRGGFYTYEAFLEAAGTFPAFASVGDDATRRRELAAFFANLGHETTGGWASAPDGAHAWGLCWITEGGTVDPSALPEYCDASAVAWPCAPGQKYFGRGPIQLSWNYNYGQCGEALGLPLLTSPELVSSDPAIAFRTALWFWMTPQAPKPSCHDVMTGAFVPSAADTAAGRAPGFGLTIDTINGGLECGHGADDRVADRIGFYERFAAILGTDVGAHLDCGAMSPF